VRPSQVVHRATAYLERHDVTSPRVSAETLMASVLGTDRAGVYLRVEPLSADEARRFGRQLCRRCSGVPLQHLTGHWAFAGLDLKMRPGVFVPRPETEVLVVEALGLIDTIAGPIVVDLGTGTGAIALALKDRRPDARMVGVDVSEDAVDLALENAGRLGLDVELARGDLMDGVPPDLRGRVDLVVSNPPYVDPASFDGLPRDVRADPRAALVGEIGVCHTRRRRGGRDRRAPGPGRGGARRRGRVRS
jgi:release factor glutamine methyltransferase